LQQLSTLIVNKKLQRNNNFLLYHSENEMDPNKVRDKEAKLEFLSKVVTVVENYLGIVIDIKPSKVVAGLEADKTRFFFQALVKAAKCSNPANFNIGPMNDRKLIQGNFENNVAGPMHSHPTKLDSNAEVTNNFRK
jgi:Microtubule-binding protein MIP-T3.